MRSVAISARRSSPEKAAHVGRVSSSPAMERTRCRSTPALRPPSTTEDRSTEWRYATRSGSCRPLGPTRAVTSSSSSVWNTSMPTPTAKARSPWRVRSARSASETWTCSGSSIFRCPGFLPTGRRCTLATAGLLSTQPRVYHGAEDRHFNFNGIRGNLDGFAMTLWTYYQAVPPDQGSPVEYAHALHRLHAGMRSVEIATPHFMERAAAAERLVTNRDATPALAEADRHLLVSTLQAARRQIRSRGAAEQLLHGEPHPGNLLSTQDGLLFIDFETCCRGPIEFDVAHVPDEVSAHYPGVDHVLLEECRRLVLAMVGAWRWDVRDEFPHGHQHGRHILTSLREGPPWPALGALA